MAEQVKVGIIGTSWWADIALLPMFTNYERAAVTAICGRNHERAEEMAAKYHVPQVFTDYRQMIEQGKLDALVVATPDDTHYAMVMAGIDAGLHIFCEKPVALNARDAKAMYEKAEAANVKHMVFYMWHWLPPMQRVKQIVDAGRLGKVYHGHFHWHMGGGRGTQYQWRVDAERANGVYGDLGSHMTHLALWTLGDVATVSAQLGFHIQRYTQDGKPLKGGNDSALVTLELTSGAQALIEISAVVYEIDSSGPMLTLFGEKGTLDAGIAVTNVLSGHLRGGFEGSDEKINEEDTYGVTFFNTHPAGRQFVDAILDDKPIYPGLYEGYKVQQVIDAALQSHESGCRVAISST